MNHLATERPASPAPLAGYWHPVLYSPEPATGERITVGIALHAAGGPRFRWLKTFDRLRRVFGNDAAKHLPFLIRHAETLVKQKLQPDSPHLHFGEMRELWSRNADVSLDDLFNRFVPLAREFEDHKPGAAVQNRRLREAVYKRLRESLDPRVQRLVPQNPSLRSNDDPPRYLDVPIQGPNRFATMVSAHARNRLTIDRNIYPSVAQLNAAAKIHQVKKVAVFLLRPDETQFSPEEYDAIDEHIHQIMFVLQKDGLTVFPEISPELVAESVRDWGLSR